jgi:hypothetical protein
MEAIHTFGNRYPIPVHLREPDAQEKGYRFPDFSGRNSEIARQSIDALQFRHGVRNVERQVAPGAVILLLGALGQISLHAEAIFQIGMFSSQDGEFFDDVRGFGGIRRKGVPLSTR